MIILRNPYRALESALGYRFRRKSRLELALTHPSHRHEQGAGADDNQRLEFLGDAALSLVAATLLYELHPDLPEGDLTRRRSRMTSTKALARAATAIGLGAHLRLGRGEEQSGGRERESNLADAMEAILGAAFLDGELRAVRAIIVHLNLAEAADVDEATTNPKGTLQEAVQRLGPWTPVYRVVRESGPSHAREFDVEVLVNDEVWGVGSGRSKRDAEMAAARQAADRLAGPGNAADR